MGRYVIAAFTVSSIFMGCKTSDNRLNESSTQGASPEAMEYVEICSRQNDCRKFSRLVMGTDHLVQGDWIQQGQREMDESEVFAVLDEAARLGINFFDTSPIYVGGVEHILGKWLKSRGPRVAGHDFYDSERLNPDRKLYALSKGGFPFDLYYAKKLEVGTHAPELKAALVKQEILAREAAPATDGTLSLSNVPAGTYASRLYGSEDQIRNRVAEELGHSINNLNADITVYLMHRDDEDFIKFDEVERSQTPVQSIMTALSHKDLSSKYWTIGWSNWQTDRISESLTLANRNPNLLKPTLNSAYFSLFEMSRRSIHAGGVQVTHEEMMDPDFQRGIKQMPYSPLGGFSILDKPEPRWENGKKAAKEKYDTGDPYWQNVFHSVFTPANEARFKRVEQFTTKFNRDHNTAYTVDQMINAYALAHPRTDFLTVGPVNVEQLRRTVASLKLAKILTTEDLDYLYRGP